MSRRGPLDPPRFAEDVVTDDRRVLSGRQMGTSGLGLVLDLQVVTDRVYDRLYS
jgi:hypothetical protein